MFSNKDLEDFAEYLGLDYEQFYESYYSLDYEETDCDLGEIPVQICDNSSATGERQTWLPDTNLLDQD